MSFAGVPVSTANRELLIEGGTGATTSLWGTPIENIATITLTGTEGDRLKTLQALEGFGPLLPLWDIPTRDHLMEGIGELIKAGQWQAAYNWSSRLAKSEVRPESRDRLALYRAWSLLEMGLLETAVEAAQALVQGIDPMEANVRLCWLMARMAIAEGEWESAKKWINLPSLQIPCRSEPLSDELASLKELIQPETNWNP